MKNIAVALTLICGLYSLGYSQKDVQESCQVTTAPLIDGKAEDWPGDWITDADTKFQYNVCFDADNLYVRLKTSDEMNQGKMGRLGFTLWLDPSGKKKKDLGLKYPTPVGRDFSQMNNSNPQNDTRTHEEKKLAMKRDFIKDTDVLELIGLAKQNIVTARVGLKNGLEVIIVMDDTGAYIYEAKIPFKAYRLSKASIPVLGVGFETGKIDAVRGAPYTDMSKATVLWTYMKLN